MKHNYFKTVIENTLDKYCTTERIDDFSKGSEELNKRVTNLEKDINNLISKFNTENDLVLYRQGRVVSEVSLVRQSNGSISINLF